MIQVKNTSLSKSEKYQIKSFFADNYDAYTDFYVTKDNQRLFIRENPEILFTGISKGDYIAWDESGVASIIGISDKADRKYFRFLVRNPIDVANLLVALLLKYNGIIYSKLKYNNPSIITLLELGFEEIAGRGEEILLKRNIK